MLEGAKTVFLDIESGPNLAYVWGKWEQNVLAYEHEWALLCVSYKWLGESTQVLSLPEFKSEKSFVKAIWEILNECQIAVAHNGNAFDFKKLNAKFIYYGLGPPSPYKTVDTLIIARRYFAFNGNKLGDLGPHLNLGKKLSHTGFELWLGCLKGDKDSWDLMKRYNKQDVILLEKIYNRFLPWIKNHPNLDNYSDSTVCSKCGSKQLVKRGYYYTQTKKYARIKCKDCGGWGQSPLNEQEKRPLKSI